MSVYGDKSDDEYSVIGDKGVMGFIDYGDDKSVCSYNPCEEGPIVISVPFPFVQQKPQSVSVDEVSSDAITVENTTIDSVELWGIHIYASTPEDSFTLSLTDPSKSGFVGTSSLEDRVLQPRKTLTVWLSCKPKDIGMHTCIVHFDVGDDKIERVVLVLAEDQISKALTSKKPYQRAKKKSEYVVESFVKGVRPTRENTRNFRHSLPQYKIPKDVRETIESKQLPEAILDGLSKKNYVPYFRALLIMEELQLEEDVRAYDMENVYMKSRGRQFLVLEVLGLAERRPSLVKGDAVFARLAFQNNDDARFYEGFIHRVEADQVYLKFDDEFHYRHHDQNQYNIRFMYSRVNMRRLYHATEAAEGLHVEFLFPSKSSEKRRIEPTTVSPISDNLNEEQLNAVKMILGCKGGVPYIINGPPGTGKTKTLVEAILQLYTTRKHSKILICASSNSAADHILDKILNQQNIRLREGDIFRLNATSRPFEDMSPNFLPFCFYEEFSFRCPPLKTLMKYRIVITTYMSSALLHAEGVKRRNFSHIILDEAGQASEPETMVPISNLCQNDTVIVLAGDPKQLGPVIFSPDAKIYGLAKSYLERMFECELYSEGDEGYVTTLTRNYRSHPDILQLPSELFYCGQLIACHEVKESVPWADLLPNKEFPILFSGVQAYDEREGNNPSWFNRTEASMVVKLIKKLIAKNVGEDSIGVITPYRQQVAKIRTALDDAGISNVKIGSVEQFQGQEREVIIISTVRSTIKHNEFDRIYCLGFLSNPKRFNVAITRARSLLVIIGNPHIICKDFNWENLLWRCVDNNAYEGCTLPERRFSDPDDPTDQQTEDWSGNTQKDTVGEWIESVDNQGTQGGWSDTPDQPLNGGWSDVPEEPLNGGWSNAPEEPISGGWSDAPEQSINGGWSEAPEQPISGGWSDAPEQPINGGWSDAPEQPINGEWSDGQDQVVKGGWSDGQDLEVKGGWSDGQDQEVKGQWSDDPDQPGKEELCDSPDQQMNRRCPDGPDEETQDTQTYPVEQGAQKEWPDVQDQAVKGEWSDGPDQEEKGGWSDGPEQPGKEELSDGPDQPVDGICPDGPDEETQEAWTDPVEQGSRSGSQGTEVSNHGEIEKQSVGSDASRQGKGKPSGAVEKEMKGEQSHISKQGEVEIEPDQELVWAEDFPEPVKDEDEWSDGWK